MVQARYRFKSAALDAAQLRKAYEGAQIGDDAASVTFKTPAGHVVSTPISNETIHNQISRLGGKREYYAALGKSLRGHARRLDSEVEEDRDRVVAARRSGAVLGGGILGMLGGGVGGYLLGGLAKSPDLGAVLGGSLGSLAGGYLGSKSKIERPSGSEHRSLDEVSELYKEPEHVKQMRAQMEDMNEHVRAIRRRQSYNMFRGYGDPRSPYYDPRSPYYDPTYPYLYHGRYPYGL
jgi:hypothetical protein